MKLPGLTREQTERYFHMLLCTPIVAGVLVIFDAAVTDSVITFYVGAGLFLLGSLWYVFLREQM